MKSAVRFYKFILCLYPSTHQEAFGAQMLQTFIDHYQDVEQSRGGVGIFFWLVTIADEMAGIARERTAWLGEGNGFGRISPGKLALAIPSMIPLYAASFALLVKISLATPHPHVSGIGFLFALAYLLLVPGIFSAVAGYAIACALLSLLPRRKASAS